MGGCKNEWTNVTQEITTFSVKNKGIFYVLKRITKVFYLVLQAFFPFNLKPI
jgi:hypothetical protein